MVYDYTVINTVQRIVFFVGPDMCGKTQIAQEVALRSGIPYFKATSEHTSFLSSRVEKNDQFLNQLRFADPRVYDLLRQTRHSVVFDRGYPCEYAYATVLGRTTDHTMLKHMDDAWASLGSKIIFCHRSTYDGICDDLDPSINAKTLQLLHDAYEEFLSRSGCRVLRLNVDDEDLTREVHDVQRFMDGC